MSRTLVKRMMNKTDTANAIHDHGLIAVLRGPSAALTDKMVEALVAGGVRVIEITYSTPNAAEVTSRISQLYGPDVIVGMGTLREPQHADRAKHAGAQFLVSPHTERRLAEAMKDTNLLTLMGALSPSEMVRASRLGSDLIKLFPGSLGGPRYLKSILSPLPDFNVVPTGGVALGNVAAWLDAGAFALGAGSELCPASWAKEGRFDEISQRADAFLTEIDKARRE